MRTGWCIGITLMAERKWQMRKKLTPQAEYLRLKAVVEKKGYKPYWIFYRMKEKFGEEIAKQFCEKKTVPEKNILACPNCGNTGEINKTPIRNGYWCECEKCKSIWWSGKKNE
jgi:hypothetical protein